MAVTILAGGCSRTTDPADGVLVFPGDVDLIGQDEVNLMAGIREIRGSLRIASLDPESPVVGFDSPTSAEFRHRCT